MLVDIVESWKISFRRFNETAVRSVTDTRVGGASPWSQQSTSPRVWVKRSIFPETILTDESGSARLPQEFQPARLAAAEWRDY
jgi:hypothetical protein